LTVVGSLLGITLYTWLLRNANPMLVSTYSYVSPLVAVTLARLAGETAPAQLSTAAGLIVLGVAMVSLGRCRPPSLSLLVSKTPRGIAV
jgi:drug/metabolite transporter (DMT)-like permease